MYSVMKHGVQYDFVLDGEFLKCSAYKEKEYAKWGSVLDKRLLKDVHTSSRCEIEYEMSEILSQLQDENIAHYPEETSEGKQITIVITTILAPTISFTNKIILDCIDTSHEEKMLYASLLAEKSANETKEEISKALEKSETEIRELKEELSLLSKKMAELERGKLNRPCTTDSDHLTQRLAKLERSMEDIISSYAGRITKLEIAQRKAPTFGM